MFGEFPPTPQDVRFRVFGIPCRIHPFFWLAGLLFSFPSGNGLPGNLVLGLLLSRIACLLISILIHELGHAVLIRWAGFEPEIVLHGFGGYAIYHPYRPIRTSTLVAISFAGPGAGFILYGLVRGVELLLLGNDFIPGVVPDLYQRMPRIAAIILSDTFLQLEYINLFWGLVNLLPIFPLDGGQIARNLMTSWWGRTGLRQSLVLSIIVSGLAAFWFYQSGGHRIGTAVVLFGILCFESIQEYQRMGRY